LCLPASSVGQTFYGRPISSVAPMFIIDPPTMKVGTSDRGPIYRLTIGGAMDSANAALMAATKGIDA
jgi:hypothetical protein